MKTRNKLPALAVAVLLALVLLAACSAGNPQYLNNQPVDEVPQASAAVAASQEAAPTPAPADQSGGAVIPEINPGDASASGKKVIYTVNITIQAKDIVSTIDDITNEAASCGGYVSDMKDSEPGDGSSGWVTVRIPPERLKEFTQHVGTLGTLLSRDMTTQDVTAQYADQQAELTNAEAQETQLLGIMKQAVTIDDILKVRKELNDEEKEIETLKGQIRLMDNQVGFCTVKIMIQQPPKPVVTPTPTPEPTPGPTGVQFWGFHTVGQRISNGLSDSFNGTLNVISWILTALSYMIVPLAIIAAVVLVVVLVVKSGSKKKKV